MQHKGHFHRNWNRNKTLSNWMRRSPQLCSGKLRPNIDSQHHDHHVTTLDIVQIPVIPENAENCSQRTGARNYDSCSCRLVEDDHRNWDLALSHYWVIMQRLRYIRHRSTVSNDPAIPIRNTQNEPQLCVTAGWSRKQQRSIPTFELPAESAPLSDERDIKDELYCTMMVTDSIQTPDSMPICITSLTRYTTATIFETTTGTVPIGWHVQERS